MSEGQSEKIIVNSERGGRYSERLADVLEPNLSAKELAEKMVRSALEIEYGHSFTLTKGFSKMVGTIADSIVTNPELRRLSLAVASVFIEEKIKRGKKKK